MTPGLAEESRKGRCRRLALGKAFERKDLPVVVLADVEHEAYAVTREKFGICFCKPGRFLRRAGEVEDAWRRGVEDFSGC